VNLLMCWDVTGYVYSHHMKQGKRSEKLDKLAWRGDADSYDSEASGPGHVDTKADAFDTFNWAGKRTGAWVTQAGDGKGGFL
jgi:hypothetical protein